MINEKLQEQMEIEEAKKIVLEEMHQKEAERIANSSEEEIAERLDEHITGDWGNRF